MISATPKAPGREAPSARTTETPAQGGLKDVVALSSDICHINGQEGELVYRGYDIQDLGANAAFEEVAFLLWNGALPTQGELDEVLYHLQNERDLPGPLVEWLKSVPPGSDAMAVLRTAISMLALYDPEAELMTPEANYRKSIRLTAQTPGIIAALDRLRKGKPYVPPVHEGSLSANFLYMLNGEWPGAAAERTLSTALVLHAEHGLNASTFAGRVSASTLSDIYSAVTGAIGALKGPLHGGANIAVMKMLLDIDGRGESPSDYIREMLRRHERIAGFGHRVYKVLDPRAAILRDMAGALSEESGSTKWYDMSLEIASTMLEAKGLYPNVDFYSASVYYTMGIDCDLYTPIFAMSRMTGWTAHFMEQWKNNRLIRPTSEYTGPRGLKVAPIGNRA